MTESELDEHIRRIVADLPSVKRYHTFDSRKSPSGFPDLVLVGPRGVLFRELKRQAKKPTPAQAEWLAALCRAGADAAVWRPSDLLSERIGRELAAIAGLVRAQ
jgi:VRR-NUC domain